MHIALIASDARALVVDCLGAEYSVRPALKHPSILGKPNLEGLKETSPFRLAMALMYEAGISRMLGHGTHTTFH